MKTLIFRNFDSSIRFDVQADILARNSELQTPGFDTRYTNMYLGKDYDDTAKALIELKETEGNVQGIISKVKTVPGIGLFVSDMNEKIDTTKVAQVDEVTLTGTSGEVDVKVDDVSYTQTYSTSLSDTAAAFVAAHAAALDAAGITVTNPSGEILKFEAKVAGVAFSLVVENVSGDLNGDIENITLNQDGSGEIALVSPSHG